MAAPPFTCSQATMPLTPSMSDMIITRMVNLLSHSGKRIRSEEHTSELQSPCNLVCRLLLEKKKTIFLTFVPFIFPDKPKPTTPLKPVTFSLPPCVHLTLLRTQPSLSSVHAKSSIAGLVTCD